MNTAAPGGGLNNRSYLKTGNLPRRGSESPEGGQPSQSPYSLYRFSCLGYEHSSVHVRFNSLNFEQIQIFVLSGPCTKKSDPACTKKIAIARAPKNFQSTLD
jgi:hypothetical protein